MNRSVVINQSINPVLVIVVIVPNFCFLFMQDCHSHKFTCPSVQSHILDSQWNHLVILTYKALCWIVVIVPMLLYFSGLLLSCALSRFISYEIWICHPIKIILKKCKLTKTKQYANNMKIPITLSNPNCVICMKYLKIN